MHPSRGIPPTSAKLESESWYDLAVHLAISRGPVIIATIVVGMDDTEHDVRLAGLDTPVLGARFDSLDAFRLRSADVSAFSEACSCRREVDILGRYKDLGDHIL